MQYHETRPEKFYTVILTNGGDDLLVRACDNDKNRILEYLSSGVEDCIYLFIDISNYSIEGDNCKVWLDVDNEDIQFVLMYYYNSYQVYGKKTAYIPERVISFISGNSVNMISGRKDLIEVLEKRLNGYNATYGEVFELNRTIGSSFDDKAEWGTIDDVAEIAKLIQTDDDIGAHYSFDDLVKQLKERILSKTGKSCIIREDGLIIAHTATYAECKELAVISGTVVHPNWRNGQYFMIVTTVLQKKLATEGKRAYTFSTSPKMIRYHRSLHKKCSEYGKLELK